MADERSEAGTNTDEDLEERSEASVEKSEDGEVIVEEIDNEDPNEDQMDDPVRRSKRETKERTFLEPSMRGKSHKDRSGQQYVQTADEREEMWCNDIFDKLVDVCFTQMTAKKGIRTYRK